ncbi:MAG: phosphoribosylglycinamide formyltransferase [Cucumibacter sp.]
MIPQKKPTAILISGRGSNMSALVAAARAPAYPAEIVGVFSNRPDAPGLALARAAGLATEVRSHGDFASRDAFDAALDAVLNEWRAEIVCLAGFMRLLTPGFVEKWSGRMINIHPSLLPAFKGLGTHARALAEGAKIHGATVHFVTPELDGGKIILQSQVKVLPGDTPATLAARVLAEEHRIYPLALAMLARGRVTLEPPHHPN